MKIALAVAVAAAITLSPTQADAQPKRAGVNCVDGSEWNSLYSPQFGDENHSARRAVIESAWDVRIVGQPNQFWVPANPDRFYSVAYNWCEDDSTKIVIVYRKTSDAWQYALKGQFTG